MKVGIVSPNTYVSDFEGIKIYNFKISTAELSFFKLMHSAFSTPARYVMEVFKRLQKIDIEPEKIFIFNPFYDFSGVNIRAVLFRLKQLIDSQSERVNRIIVFADSSNNPIGYFFPEPDKPDHNYLLLLSTIDCNLDRELLGKLYLQTVDVEKLDNFLVLDEPHNGFYYYENIRFIYRWTAEKALKTISEFPGEKSSIPLAAFMPFHAGDLLFFALAAARSKTFFRKVVVSRHYQDILKEVPSGLEPELIDFPLPFRDGKNAPEEVVFKEEIIEKLNSKHFYYYCRPSRDYSLSKFHLIDHFAFALGTEITTKEDLPSKKQSIPEFQPVFQYESGFKILFHADGGWPLKIYPTEFQNRLISKLLSFGFSVTVLGTKDEKTEEYEQVRFRSMEQLKELMGRHHLLVGMDSFPCHYAAHVLGMPTVCLFSSTQPVNSDATISERYLYLERGLPCRPCGAVNQCPKNLKIYCENFIEPELVAEEIRRMLLNVFRASN